VQSKAVQAFDHAYFNKYYYSPATRVTTRAEMKTRAGLIAAVLKHAQIPVHSMLDAGCGIGLMRAAFKSALPKARYTGLEASEYLCRRYGWVKDSIAAYRPPKPFDLLVCYDVMQYLDDREAVRALANFARLTRAALYFSALTVADWRNNCDRSLTDSNVHLRSGDWYRRRLQKNFRHLGYGVWVRRTITVIRWDLESPQRP
jgi:predicted TPR repeat methyltransferase